MNINNDRAPLRWRLTVCLINYSQNVYEHCARKEHAITLYEDQQWRRQTLFFSLRAICNVRHDATRRQQAKLKGH